MANLGVKLGNIDFKNPVVMASGTFGFGKEYNEIYDIQKLGGVSSKGLTLEKRDGNKGMRVWETPSGMMNSVGLENPGVQGFIDNELQFFKDLDLVRIANLGGSTLDDYVKGAELLNNQPIDMIELNISCPNVKSGGMAFGIKSEVAYDVVKKAKAIVDKPLMVKLSPNAEDICNMAYRCAEAGADSISLINTLKGMAIDIKNRKPVFNNVYAGLSGPAVKPIALRMVHEVAKTVDIPVIGLGGISTAEDAIEFMMAGAKAIQIGTINFVNPKAGIEIIKGLEDFCKKEGFYS